MKTNSAITCALTKKCGLAELLSTWVANFWIMWKCMVAMTFFVAIHLRGKFSELWTSHPIKRLVRSLALVIMSSRFSQKFIRLHNWTIMVYSYIEELWKKFMNTLSSHKCACDMQRFENLWTMAWRLCSSGCYQKIV
jgi:hypothetical protein